MDRLVNHLVDSLVGSLLAARQMLGQKAWVLGINIRQSFLAIKPEGFHSYAIA